MVGKEVLEVLEVQNCARLNKLQRKTRGNIQIYKDAWKEARKVCRRKKNFTKKKNWKNCKRSIKETVLKILWGYTKDQERFPTKKYCVQK
jgi:mRNA degradation ribonuclease J1/J2